MKRFNRIEPARAAALLLALPLIAALVAFLVAAVSTVPPAGQIVAAVALVAVAGTGLVYAWRLGPGGLSD